VDRGRLQLDRYAVDLALPEARQVKRGLSEGLGRDHAETGNGNATDRPLGTLDEGDALANVRCFGRGLLTGGAGTNDDQIEGLDVRLELSRHHVSFSRPQGH
jgi:hypothetical protein